MRIGLENFKPRIFQDLCISGLDEKFELAPKGWLELRREMIRESDATSFDEARAHVSWFDKADGLVGCTEAVDAVRHSASRPSSRVNVCESPLQLPVQAEELAPVGLVLVQEPTLVLSMVWVSGS